MRPVRIQMEGFGAFRALTEIDLDGVDLFALVGPTGAGKSTVIDALCFALYGSVPRLGEKLIQPVMSVGNSSARVLLDFDVDGERYRVSRELRLKADGKGLGPTQARLERDPDGAAEALGGTVKEVNVQVADLLGLDFDQFTKCVVLPQGEFARFLHARSTERQAILEQLLGAGVYSAIGAQARARAKELATAVRLQAERLAELGDATPEAVAAAGAAAAALAAVREEIDARRPELDELKGHIDAAAAERAALDQQIRALRAIAIPDEFDSLATTLADATARLADAEAALADATAAEAAAEAAVEPLGSATTWTRILDAHERLGDLREQLSAVEKEASEAVTVRDAALAARQVAVSADDEADALLRRLEREDAAQALVADLAVGEACPVCRQVVVELPDHDDTEHLHQARQARAEAAAARQRAERAATDAEIAAANLDARRQQLAGELSPLSDQVAEHPDADAVRARLAALTDAHTQLDAAKKARTAATAAVGSARASEQQARAALADSQVTFDTQRDGVAAFSPPVRTGDLAADWAGLVEWSVPMLAEAADRLAAADQRSAQLVESRNAVLHGLKARVDEVGVAVPSREGGADASPAADRLRDAVADAAWAAQSTVERLASRLDERATVQAGHDADESARQVAELLGQQLHQTKFLNWMLAEATATLADDASEMLRSLSGQAFSLDVDDSGDFIVVDHRNADERRPVKTLSGGETFQASLALALALANHLSDLAAERAASIDAIFLDEGFGTLDEDSLDVVAGTIESLGAGDRMVGVITHVRELAERIPVRFRVSRTERTAVLERDES